MNDTTEKVQVTVRLNPETLSALDAIRGRRSRQHMISGAINLMIDGRIDVPLPPKPEPMGVIVDSLNEQTAA